MYVYPTCFFAHLPSRGSTHRGRVDKGAAKIVKKLGFDYAEAVVRATFFSSDRTTRTR